jgi:hypothetical protein
LGQTALIALWHALLVRMLELLSTKSADKPTLVIKIVSCELREIDLVAEEEWEIDDIIIDSPLLELEDLTLKLESKFLDQRKLRGHLRPL